MSVVQRFFKLLMTSSRLLPSGVNFSKYSQSLSLSAFESYRKVCGCVEPFVLQKSRVCVCTNAGCSSAKGQESLLPFCIELTLS